VRGERGTSVIVGINLGERTAGNLAIKRACHLCREIRRQFVGTWSKKGFFEMRW
jgi:hypothetical protein